MRVHLAKQQLMAGILLVISLDVMWAAAVTAWPYQPYMTGAIVEERNLLCLNYSGNREIGYQAWVLRLDLSSAELESPSALLVDGNARAEAWRSVTKRCTLSTPLAFDIAIHFKGDSVGVDSTGSGATRYEGQLLLEADGRAGTMNLVVFCDMLVSVHGIFEIPDRSELVAVVSYKGVPGKCDQIDVPVLLVPVE